MRQSRRADHQAKDQGQEIEPRHIELFARPFVALRVTGKLLRMRRHAVERSGLGVRRRLGLGPGQARSLRITGQIGQGAVGSVDFCHRCFCELQRCHVSGGSRPISRQRGGRILQFSSEV